MYYVKGKGVFENSGRKVGSKRKMDLALARVYGSQNNREQFTRLVIESKVRMNLLEEQFRIGLNLFKP